MEEVKEKSIVTSYRLAQDTKDKLQQQLKDLGMTQEQYFNKAVSFMELENVKQNSFLNKDTTIIQTNLDAILNAFISVADSSNNLISNKDAELEALKNKYKNMLVDKESLITEQKHELQGVYDNLKVLQNEKDNIMDGLRTLKVDYIKEREQLDGRLKDKDLIVEEYKSKNDMLLSDLAEYKQYKTKNEELNKLLADAQARTIDLENVVKDNNSIISNLNKSIEDLRLDKDKTIKELNQKHSETLQMQKEKSDLLKDKLILELDQKHNTELQEQQAKYNKEVTESLNKYRELVEELKTTSKSIPKTKAVPKDK